MGKNGPQTIFSARKYRKADSKEAKKAESRVLDALGKAVQLNTNQTGGADKYKNLILKAMSAAAAVHTELISRIHNAAFTADSKSRKWESKSPGPSREALKSLLREFESGKIEAVGLCKRIPCIKLPSHVSSRIVEAALGLARHVATFGVGENIKAHGFSIVIGNADELMSRDRKGHAKYGEPHMSNIFEAKDMRMTNWEADKRYVLMAFTQDGAIIVDGISGRFVAAAYLVTDLRKGANGGGARHKSASAIATQAGGCFVIECSQDACKKGIAKFDIFCKQERQKLNLPSSNQI
eukprot:gnl/MRDRNA2_/MRDRNA2_175336_c0_seq1.p1 gnl/MRDRNA2_/MRDRNA2_175336_c0~~gnl/MRDRNA2_/MRDRNA2_175336_c0_seq1.p1  ORF type:complete len:295 (-),score=56.73 gnl/MRDRNA2_/MRDRNA2_175336_c0_seq1:142-1026(-)